MVYFKNIPIQVSVILKILLYKRIAKYRVRVFLPDAIHSRSQKSNSTEKKFHFLRLIRD